MQDIIGGLVETVQKLETIIKRIEDKERRNNIIITGFELGKNKI